MTSDGHIAEEKIPRAHLLKGAEPVSIAHYEGEGKEIRAFEVYLVRR